MALILFLSQNDIFTVSFALAILRTKRFVEEFSEQIVLLKKQQMHLSPLSPLPHPFSVVKGIALATTLPYLLRI